MPLCGAQKPPAGRAEGERMTRLGQLRGKLLAPGTLPRPPVARLTVRGLILALVVIIGSFMAWDYHATTATHIREKKAALEDEATILLDAIEELGDQSPDTLQKFIDRISASISETTSPGHHIALVTSGGVLQDNIRHRASPELLAAMKRGAAVPNGIAAFDGDRIVVGWESTPENTTTIYVSEYMSNVYTYGRDEVLRRVVSTIVLGLVLAGVLYLLLYLRITRPLKAMARIVRGFGKGDYKQRMPEPGTAELGLLADEFDHMAVAIQKANGEQSRLAAALDARNKDLGRFIYVTSHDLRAPVVNIEGFGAELSASLAQAAKAVETAASLDQLKAALEPLLKTDMPESVEFIRTSAARLHALIEGLLQLSRVGHTELKPVDIDAAEMLREIVRTMQFQITSAGATVTIEELPPCRGDREQLTRLFSNLLTNAVKYLDPARPGVIRVSGRLGKGRAVYSVADNGIGIPPEEQQKVFDILHRVNPKGPVQGEGLGLAIVKRIVERHGGSITLESAAGSGSTFTIDLAPASS
jgi:signal transduction histidine kinase